MENEKLVALQRICEHYNIDHSFIRSLNEYGLVEIIIQDESPYINVDSIGEIERMIHLHYELEINLEGIDAINNLLKRINDMQKELTALRNKL